MEGEREEGRSSVGETYHCASGGCLKDTGECETGGCAVGWTGVNCQGKFGWGMEGEREEGRSSVGETYHCASGGCLKDIGECETGGCAVGWTGVNCQG